MIFKRQRQINQEIPETTSGLSDSLRVLRGGKVDNMKLRVNISHPHNGDLGIVLQAPSGKRVDLVRPSNDNSSNLNKTFDSKEVLKEFIGQEVEGQWTLNVVDHAKAHIGSVHTWEITLSVPAGESEVYVAANKEEPLMSQQYCPQEGKVRSMKAVVEIEEVRDEALSLFLTAPSGKDVELYSRDKKTKGDIIDDFTKEFSAKDLSKFSGQEANGIWSLHVKGPKAKKGRLKKWSLDIQV